MVRLPSEVTLSSQKLLLEKPTWSMTPFLFVAPIHRMPPSSDWLILAAFVPSDMDQRDTESYLTPHCLVHWPLAEMELKRMWVAPAPTVRA